MADSYREIQGQTNDFIRKLSFQQKATIAGVTIISLVGIIILVMFLSKPTYGVLYSNLNPEDASRIVDRLRDQGVPYNLDANGRTILVPEGQVYDLRLSFAGEGLPQHSIIGYEIFDRSNLGVSDFVQRVHYRRALEGEIARTIIQLDEVEAARVHIVVPERALFREDEKPATASVVLKLWDNRPLNARATRAIAHLVASSVTGLEAENVTIVDGRGNLLSGEVKKDFMGSLTSAQIDLQRDIEKYLSDKARSLLEGIVGRGNAIVQVHADLNFRKVERTLEMYDADEPAIRSEQLSEERHVVDENIPPSISSHTVTNYEINRTIENIVEEMGNINRLSVAAIVNGTRRPTAGDEEQAVEYVPRSDEEMEYLTDIVSRAVGYNPERNDEISVVNLPFSVDLDDSELIFQEAPPTDWYKMLEIGLLVIAMLSAFIILRSLLNKFTSTSTYTEDFSIGEIASQEFANVKREIEIPGLEEEVSEESMKRAEKRKRIQKYINEQPDEGARLVKVWLTEE